MPRVGRLLIGPSNMAARVGTLPTGIFLTSRVVGIMRQRYLDLVSIWLVLRSLSTVAKRKS